MGLKKEFKDYVLFRLETEQLDPLIIQEIIGLAPMKCTKNSEIYKRKKNQKGFIEFKVEGISTFLDILEKKINQIKNLYNDIDIKMVYYIIEKGQINGEVLPETMEQLVKFNINLCFSYSE